MPSQCELNRAAWPILAKAAMGRSTITYGDLAKQVSQAVGQSPPYSARHIGENALDLIERYCRAHSWPDLTAVVVSVSTGIPGQDFFATNFPDRPPSATSEHERRLLWEVQFDAVSAHPWSMTPPPDLC